jgi:hypothetical protein
VPAPIERSGAPADARARRPDAESHRNATPAPVPFASRADGSVAECGEGLSDGARAVPEGGYLGAAIARGMEHDGDDQARVADEAKSAGPDLVVDVKALGAHAGHHLALRSGEAVRTGGGKVALLTERREPGPEEPAPPPRRRGGAGLLIRKVRYEPVQLASRHCRVRTLEPFVEFIDRQAAGCALVAQPPHDRISLGVTRANLLLGHRGRI